MDSTTSLDGELVSTPIKSSADGVGNSVEIVEQKSSEEGADVALVESSSAADDGAVTIDATRPKILAEGTPTALTTNTHDTRKFSPPENATVPLDGGFDEVVLVTIPTMEPQHTTEKTIKIDVNQEVTAVDGTVKCEKDEIGAADEQQSETAKETTQGNDVEVYEDYM